MQGKSCVNGYFIEGNGSLLDSLPARQHANQDWVRIVVRALRRWLETHELSAIIAGVVAVLILLSMLLVVGGYLLVTP